MINTAPIRFSAAAIAAALAAACAGEDDDRAPGPLACPEAGVAVAQGWIRPAREGRDRSAAYLALCNGGPQEDFLVSATIEGAARAELHITETDENGVVTMRPIAEIPLPKGQPVTLGPGGAHVMAVELAAPIEAGAQREATLYFQNAPAATITLEARTDAPE